MAIQLNQPALRHARALIREGKVANAGRKARPLIRRSDLPSKPNWKARTGTDGSESDYILGGLFRDISTSKFGV